MLAARPTPLNAGAVCAVQLLDMGERLIKAGILYADNTPVDQMREVCVALSMGAAAALSWLGAGASPIPLRFHDSYPSPPPDAHLYPPPTSSPLM